MTKEEISSSSEETKKGASGAGLSLEAEDKYQIDLESMLKAGVHFGHKKARWNPKMDKYIFGQRGGVHILDLEKTVGLFEEGMQEVSNVVKKNGIILLVGTKKQVKDLVKAVGEKAGIPYVNERWLGGTITNFGIIKKRVKYLVDNKEALEKKKMGHMTKLERSKLQKKLDKIEERMGGLVAMTRLPDLIFILDINKDETAVAEARKAGIKTMGLVDSNSNPEKVNYPIPANDDALSSLKYVLGVFLKTIVEAKKKSVDPHDKGDGK